MPTFKPKVASIAKDTKEPEAARQLAAAVAKKQEKDARLAAVAEREAEVKVAAEALVVRLSVGPKSEQEAAKIVVVRMQLEKEAGNKWDAEIVSAKSSDSSAASATGLPAPVYIK